MTFYSSGLALAEIMKFSPAIRFLIIEDHDVGRMGVSAVLPMNPDMQLRQRFVS